MLNTLSRECRSKEQSRLLGVSRADLVSGNWGLSNLETASEESV